MYRTTRDPSFPSPHNPISSRMYQVNPPSEGKDDLGRPIYYKSSRTHALELYTTNGADTQTSRTPLPLSLSPSLYVDPHPHQPLITCPEASPPHTRTFVSDTHGGKVHSCAEKREAKPRHRAARGEGGLIQRACSCRARAPRRGLLCPWRGRLAA